MPFPEHSPRFRGITLPPSGWALALLLSLYIFVGLIGHDPWKHDDAITIGVVFEMFSSGNWLLPHLAGQPYPDAPLYYWIATLFAKLFAWLLPVHEGARLASGLCTLLSLQFILLAARELHGKDFAASAPLTLAGSIGFLYHAHEAQPMLAVLMAHTAAYWALALLPRRPQLAVPVFGVTLATAFLAAGLLPVLVLVPLVVITLALSEKRSSDTLRLLAGVLLALALCAAWLLPVNLLHPQYGESLLRSELAEFSRSVPLNNLLRYLSMLLWYAWPALPLAAWALWSKRRVLKSRPLLLPLLAFFSTLLLLACLVPSRSAPTLLLLPPLVLFAVPGVATLRRGAANAFDWFGMMTFTFFLSVCWIVWGALVFGWPARLARQAVRLHPGFVGQIDLLAAGFALALSLIWFWMIATSPRSPMRGTMHWMAGLTLFWVLVATLLMPWIDYGKTYRSIATGMAKALPPKIDCIVNANLPNAVLGTLDYFSGIRTVPLTSTSAGKCHWLVMYGEPRDAKKMADAGWRKVWEGNRPSDRRSNEKTRLYRRDAGELKSSGLGDIRDFQFSPDETPLRNS